MDWIRSNLLRVVASLALVPIMCLSTACVSRSDATAESPNLKSHRASYNRWQVTLAVSGGYAGENYELTVDNLGAVQLNDLKRQISRHKVLTRDTLFELRRSVAAAPLQSLQKVNDRCADCLQYSLRITRSASTTTFSLDSTTLHDSPVESLIAQLAEIWRQG